ncbi:MAG TPA: hypothetical protein VN380_21445 [Thermoanaerobaculia bacterium]|jgi:hypothetical protein|nr:hypothetical protein [Thermoanaerobaculia bacterium]
MLHLRPSGERSFEELIARLLSKVSGERIRLCKAGTQSGVDAMAEIPFAIQNKRYATQLTTGPLEGELSQAVGRYPDLQLWVLVATCRVSAQTGKEVTDAGLRQGVAVKILDATASEPELLGVGGLAALAATDIATTMAILADPKWRTRGPKPNLTAIGAALHEIHELPDFDRWEEHLRRELRDLPIWHRLVRSQNKRLRSLIMNNAGNAFGTPYDASKAVSRSVEAELTNWAQACTGTAISQIAVVTGDRYDGKTTLVYRWLVQNLSELPIPVFFFRSRAVESAHGDVETLVLREAREALGSFARHASNLIERQRSRNDAGAWCVIVLDGANEYRDRQARSTAVLWALPTEAQTFRRDGDRDRAITSLKLDTDAEQTKKRECALLVTCRSRDFEEDSSWLDPWQKHRVNLGPYNDEEFADALARRNLVPSEVADLPESAAAMIRHPRYLDVMLQHRDELGQFSAITADVLHYFDAFDKVPSDARLNADTFKAFLSGLAAAWTKERRLNYSGVLRQLREVTDSVDASMAILLSEGVLTRKADGFFVPDRERLALGMGLFIRESLLHLPENAQAEKLKDILEPHSDDDEKVRWLRAAVTTSILVGDTHTNPGTVDCLLAAWLSSRNFSQHDLEDVKSHSPLLIEAVLRVVSRDSVNSAVLLLAQAMIETEMPRRQGAIADAIRRWFRLVPTDSFLQGDDGLDDTQRVVLAVSEGSLHDLELRLTAPSAGRSVRERHTLGLSVAYTNSIVEPIDLLALASARGVTHWNLDDGERFAVRMLLTSAGRAWFENEVRSCDAKPDASRATFLHDLIRYSERADLIELQLKLPAEQTFEWPRPLSQTELRGLDDTQDAKEMLHTARRAATLAIDPGCPRPLGAWRLKLAKAAVERFDDSPKLHVGRGTTLDDLDLEHLEPALAAWAPDAGASIVRAFLADIPRRIAAEEESWSWALEDNAALLTRAERGQLLDLIRVTPAKDTGFQHALRRAYLCVMAGAPPSERLRLLLDHPFGDFEWTEFYEVLAATGNDELRRRTAQVVRKERDPRRLKRARYFLANQGGWEASSADLARLISDVSQEDSGGDAARTLLRYSRIATTTPASALGLSSISLVPCPRRRGSTRRFSIRSAIRACMAQNGSVVRAQLP